MRELHLSHGTIFNVPESCREAVCITTNGIVKKNGAAVMGAGIAKAAVKRYIGIDIKLGKMLTQYGNEVHYLGQWVSLDTCTHSVFSFPTKHHWKDPSDLELIKRSALQLKLACDAYKIEKCYLPRPGCQNGGLDWATVKTAIEPILDDRFIVITSNERA